MCYNPCHSILPWDFHYTFCEVALVVFGTDKIFYMIKNALEAEDVALLDEVFRVIDSDLAFLAHSPNLPHDAFDDVMQEIKLSVWKGISDFVEKSENMHPNQRNKWLREIAKYRINDYHRKNNTVINKITDSEWQLVDDEFRSVFDSYADPSANIEEYHLTNDGRLAMRGEFFNLCKFICSIVKSPESIILFFYNKLIIPYWRGTTSGSPKEIRDIFSGKTVVELRDMLVTELQLILCCNIPDDVFSELDVKITQNPECLERILTMSDSRISDISYKVQSTIKNRY